MIRVFISSVQREFAEERQLLCKYIREDALLGKFFLPFIFEELPAINLSAPEAYLTEASTSDIYLGLYGHDYGYEDAEGISPTEREYDAATENNRHRIVFIKRCDERHPKEQNFIHKVEQDVVRKSFDGYDELRTAVYAALIRFLEEKEYLRLFPWDASIFRLDSDFKVTIWRKQVTQKTDEVILKNDEVILKTDELTQKRTEVDHKIEQLSQKAVQLSQKLSQGTIEAVLYSIYNDAYISAPTMAKLAGTSVPTVKRYLSFLTENGFISHVGPDKGGYRIINWSKLDA